MRVTIEHFPKSNGANGEVEYEGEDVIGLLRQLQVPPDSVLVVRRGVPIPVDTGLQDGDELRIVWTISGG